MAVGVTSPSLGQVESWALGPDTSTLPFATQHLLHDLG